VSAPVTTSRARLLLLWTPVAAYMAAIFYVSAMPIAPLPPGIDDKTGHNAAYVGLAVLAVRAVGGGLPCRVILSVAALAFAIAAGYGMLDEFHQWFVPGRSADLADWYADATGALTGIGLCWLWGIIAVRSDV
jgi:VanZ family protein